MQKYIKKSGEWGEYIGKTHLIAPCSHISYTIFLTKPNIL